MTPSADYLNRCRELLATVESQHAAIQRTADWFAETILAGRMVHLFGSGHSRILVEEMWPRYGSFSGLTNGGAAVSASNIQQYMDTVAVQLIRGTDKPDLIVADNNYYRLYLQSLQSIQRISDSGNSSAGAGFASLKYYGAGMASDVVLDGGIGSAATANHMFFLNTKYIMFRPHADRNFVPIGGERQAVVGVDVLQHGDNALETHAGIDVLGRQRLQLCGAVAVVLNEYEVP